MFIINAINYIINSRRRIYTTLLVVTLVFAGGSVLYMSYLAHTSEAPNAKLYPASALGVGGVTIDNVIISKNIVEHKIFSRDTEPPYLPDTWRTPGYPFFVAGFYALFGSFYPVIVAQIILLFFTSILIFKMAEKMIDKKWALAVALLYIILPDTLLSTSALFTESTFVFVLVAAFYILFFAEFKNFYTKFLLAGFLLAISAYIRPASFYLLLFLVPGYFFFYLKRSEISRKQFVAIGLLVLIFLATLAPWYVRNKQQVGVWTFASTSSYVLFRQNAAQFYAALNNNLPILEARNALLKRAGLPPGTVPRDTTHSAVMKKVAIEVILEHPFRYTLFHLSSFIPFFTSSGINEYSGFVDQLLPDHYRAPEPSLIQALNPFSLSLFVTVLKNHGWTLVENLFWALVTLFSLLSFWKGKNLRLNRIFLVIIFYFALATGPIAHARYRIPVEPLLLLTTFSALLVLTPMFRDKFFVLKNKWQILK